MRKKYIVTNPPSGSNIIVDSINLPTGTSQEFELEIAKYLLRIYGFLSLEEKQIEDFYNSVDTVEDIPVDISESQISEQEQKTPETMEEKVIGVPTDVSSDDSHETQSPHDETESVSHETSEEKEEVTPES